MNSQNKLNNDTKRRSISSTKEFQNFMKSNWEKSSEFKISGNLDNDEVRSITKKRREFLFNEISKEFGIDSIVYIQSGDLKTRNNDCDYYYRPHSTFAYLTALGEDFEPNSTLVIDKDGSKLFVPSPMDEKTANFYLNSRYGEYWIGKRPKISEFERYCGISTFGIQDLPKFEQNSKISFSVERIVAEMKLVKDDFEIIEIQNAIKSTKIGFENSIKSFKESTKLQRGERLIESRFAEIARIEGNEVGYCSIVASANNATTLHWTRNNSKIRANSFILMDMGIEANSLYTADITRCFPINGKFNETQKMIYEAVLDSADTVIKEVKPQDPFRKLNTVAFEVLIKYLKDWGILPIKGIKDLDAIRRFMPHGTSHHLGLDVHDCTHARDEKYSSGILEVGMVFSVEPGLYFKETDSLIPKELRGIGVRIEDDVVMSENGIKNLSSFIPRTVQDVENWIESLTSNS